MKLQSSLVCDHLAPRILIVEDEALIALDLEDMLAHEGFDVLPPAPSIDAALSVVAQDVPDLAVLDVNIRGRLITPVAAALHARAVPFVLTTASRRQLSEHEMQGEVFRGVTVLGKPVSRQDLLSALERLLQDGGAGSLPH